MSKKECSKMNKLYCVKIETRDKENNYMHKSRKLHVVADNCEEVISKVKADMSNVQENYEVVSEIGLVLGKIDIL